MNIQQGECDTEKNTFLFFVKILKNKINKS